MDRRERYIGVALLGCMAVVLFWEIMAGRSVRPLEPFQLTGKDFEGFSPVVSGWEAEPVPVSSDPVEPNILAFRLTPTGRIGTIGDSTLSSGRPRSSFLIRLAHGYNMPQCMKIKGYRVEEEKGSSPEGALAQCWRVIDSIGNHAKWMTSLIRADDFIPVAVDIGTIAFPRVGIPDEFGREEQGIRWDDLRRPVESLSLFFRAKWNAARCDPATFLKLRQPAWASGQVLAVVTVGQGAGGVDVSAEGGNDPDIRKVHQEFCSQIREWHRRNSSGADGSGRSEMQQEPVD